MLNETSRVTGCQGVALQLHAPVKASALSSACAVPDIPCACLVPCQSSPALGCTESAGVAARAERRHGLHTAHAAHAARCGGARVEHTLDRCRPAAACDDAAEAAQLTTHVFGVCTVAALRDCFRHCNP